MIYERNIDDAKVSKFPIWVNRKIAEYVPVSQIWEEPSQLNISFALR